METNKHKELVVHNQNISYDGKLNIAWASSAEAANVVDFTAALASNTLDTTSYDEFTSLTQHLAVVENTMAVFLPSLPVVGYAAAVLEGMDESIHVLNIGVKSVALEASFDPSCHEGGSTILRSRRYFIWKNEQMKLTGTQQV